MVLAYHGGVAGLSVAGFFGVDVFFVLSGFLITSLLLAEQTGSGRLRFGAFWARRVRRLIPALLLMLTGVAVYVGYFAPAGRYPSFRSDALSVLAYVSNWHFISASSNYFSATAAPSLLTHTWSLAIEEQFYLLWPLLVAASAWVARRRGWSAAGVVLGISGFGAVASAGWMAVLFGEGASASRLYYGTDTHASALLVGAALAAGLALRPGPRTAVGRAGASRKGMKWPTVAAVLAIAGVGWAACSLASSDPVAYQGGFLAVAVAVAVLLAALVTCPASPVARVLSFRPWAYVGRISYGMYLWYFPLFSLIDHQSTGLSGPALLACRVAADLAIAAASFHLVESPILRRSPAPSHRFSSAPPRSRPVVALAVSVVAVAALVTAVPGASPGVDQAAAGVAEGPVPAEAGTATHPIRLLITGDSTGMTLGLALAAVPADRRDGLVVDDVALMGCGVAISSAIREHGVTRPPAGPCDSGSPPAGQWPTLLARSIASFHPDVVLVAAGRWEVESRQAVPGGPWTDINSPADRAYVRNQLALAARVAAAGGARVALATAPCFSSGEQPDGSAWPEDGRARLDYYNAAVRSVAAAARPAATVVDLDSMVCPGGRFHSQIAGVTVRAPDGVHYPFFSVNDPDSADPDTVGQAEAFGLWITPQLVAALSSAGAAVNQ